MSESKKLQRDLQNAKIGGVCAGVAEYFAVDVTLVRIVFVLLLIVSFGAMLLAYLAMWLIMPAKPVQPASPPVVAASPPPP